MHLAPRTQQISLKDIHGAEIPFIWVAVSQAVDFDEHNPTVLVVGSAVELEERAIPVASGEDLLFQCAGVAEILGKHGFNLVTDACPGIPNLIEKSFMDQPGRGVALDLSVLRSPGEQESSRAYSPTGFPACGDILAFCGAGFEMLSILNTHCADLVLVVGGGLGSLMEGIIAVVNDLPVICFSPAGGVSGEMQDLFERYRSRYKNLRITTCQGNSALDEYFTGFAVEFRQLNKPSRLEKFISQLDSTVGTTPLETDIVVHKDLSKISYLCGPNSIRIEDPDLVIDDVRILRDTATGVALRSHLDSAPRKYRYDGVTIRVPAGIPPVVWCPSIDTFAMIAAMRPFLRGSYSSALDVGTGTGIIAHWLAETGRIDQVLGIDSNPEATRCAAVNSKVSGVSDRCQVRNVRYQQFRQEGSRFDLITCTPPYVPIPHGESREDGNFEGVNLVIELLSSLDLVLNPQGECFLTLSSTTWTDSTVRSLMQGLVQEGRATLIEERPLPFKLSDILLDERWLKELVDGGGVFRVEDGHYAYWHRFQVWHLVSDSLESGEREP